MKWRRNLSCLFSMLIFCVAMASIVSRVSASTPKVYVYPEMITTPVGETFIISIKISDVSDLYGWEFILEWNATILDFISVEEGPFLKQNPRLTILGTWFYNTTMEDQIDNDSIWAAAGTYGQVKGVNGNGILATVTFLVQEVGETPLHFLADYTTLANSRAEVIEERTLEDGYFTNVAGLPIPSFTYSPLIPEIGENITFDASASRDPDTVSEELPRGNITSYFWEFGDETNTTEADPITYHVYEVAGDKIVTLTVTDNSTLSISLSKKVRVRYPHDVAVTSVSASPTEVTAGETVSITVTVLNNGTETETFDITVYYDSIEAATPQTVTNLAANETRTLSFSWNTAGVAEGTYRIKAAASNVEGEIITDNNERPDGDVEVKPAAQQFPLWYVVGGGAIAFVIVGVAFWFMRRRSQAT